MPPHSPLVLASTSPYRRELLARFGLPFDTLTPGVDETPLQGEAPAARALRLAAAKARAVATARPDAIVIGSDQVASLGQVASQGEDPGQDVANGPAAQLLRKPGSAERCREQLLALRGRVACFDTAVVVLWRGGLREHVDSTRVTFRAFSTTEADAYIAREPAFDCAGGFKCEGLGVTLMSRLDTTDPTALIGLPLIWLAGALRDAGLPLP